MDGSAIRAVDHSGRAITLNRVDNRALTRRSMVHPDSEVNHASPRSSVLVNICRAPQLPLLPGRLAGCRSELPPWSRIRDRQLPALVKIHREVPDLLRGPRPVPASDHVDGVRITTIQHERCRVRVARLSAIAYLTSICTAS
jgi:hypothetical protein